MAKHCDKKAAVFCFKFNGCFFSDWLPKSDLFCPFVSQPKFKVCLLGFKSVQTWEESQHLSSRFQTFVL